MAEEVKTSQAITTSEDGASQLEARFEQAIQRDTREGYSGLIVDSAQLLDVALFARDQLGYDYLSSATAVDYLGKGDHLEMVYHLYRTSGGPALVLKAQTDRENAVLPSLTPRLARRGFPGARSLGSDGHPL